MEEHDVESTSEVCFSPDGQQPLTRGRDCPWLQDRIRSSIPAHGTCVTKCGPRSIS